MEIQSFASKVTPESDVVIILPQNSNAINVYQVKSFGAQIVKDFFQEIDNIAKGTLIESAANGADYAYFPSATITRGAITEQLAEYLRSQGHTVIVKEG